MTRDAGTSVLPTKLGEPAESAKFEKVNQAPSEAEPVSAAANDQPSFEETNVWPTETEEAAFIAESRGRPESVPVVAKAEAEENDENPKVLPKLDELVERIPSDTRELLDELFRAKFTTVRRVKKRDLKH